MLISDWSSDVCASDLVESQIDRLGRRVRRIIDDEHARARHGEVHRALEAFEIFVVGRGRHRADRGAGDDEAEGVDRIARVGRSEEHTSELQSLMRISYAVFCLKKKINSTYY